MSTLDFCSTPNGCFIGRVPFKYQIMTVLVESQGSSHRHTERQPLMAVSPSWQLARSTSWEIVGKTGGQISWRGFSCRKPSKTVFSYHNISYITILSAIANQFGLRFWMFFTFKAGVHVAWKFWTYHPTLTSGLGPGHCFYKVVPNYVWFMLPLQRYRYLYHRSRRHQTKPSSPKMANWPLVWWPHIAQPCDAVPARP